MPGKVLVELDPFEKYFDKGQLLKRPQIAYDKPMLGTVRGVGRGCTVRPGHRVLVPWARGHDLGIAGQHHVMVSEYADDDIIAVVDEEDAA